MIDRNRPKILAACALIALPAVIFYSVLALQLVNLPDADDYYVFLNFMNRMSVTRGVAAKASYFLSAQYLEYKLFLQHALVWLLATSSGRVDFRILSAIGDGFVLLLVLVLWKMFLPGHGDTATRLMFFVPVPWLVFQFQYAELLNFPNGVDGHLPVLVFSLGAVFLLVRKTRGAYLAALCCLILAVSSFANGLLIVPIGAAILLMRRQYMRAAGWIAVSAGCAAAYAYRYTAHSAQGPVHFSILSVLVALPLYLLTFLGSAAAFPLRNGYVGIGVLLCPLVGLVLCIFFVAVARRGYFHRNPLVGYCVLFLFLSAVMVVGGRAEGGFLSAYSSRYGIYSMLLLVFAWFAVVEEGLLARIRISLAQAITLAIVFSLAMDVLGWRYMVDRNRELVDGIAAFERSSTSGPVLPIPGEHPWRDQLVKDSPAILKKSEELGIYEPPPVMKTLHAPREVFVSGPERPAF